jgi:hypothetical protein
MNAKTAAALIGTALLALGILGFFPNPVVSANGLFVVNTTQNAMHLATGAVLLAVAFSSLGAEMALKIIGVGYAVIAGLDLAMDGPMLLGLVATNQTDQWLHAAFAVVILAAGFVLADEAMA